MGSRGLAAIGAILSLMIIMIMAILPALAQNLPPECAARDAAATEQVRTVIHRDDPQSVWLLHYMLGSLKMARGLCVGQQPGQAERVYSQIDAAFAGHSQLAERPVQEAQAVEF